jgi:hypothetical protein
MATGAVGNERNTGFSHQFRRCCRLTFGDLTEAEAVADRDLAPEAQRTGAGADFVDVEKAHLARFVQVDVEPDAVSLRDREDAVELALWVAVDF